MTTPTPPRPHPGARPYVALALGTLGLGLSAIFVRWAGAPGAVAGFYRMGLAALVMALPAAARLRPPARFTRRHVALAVLAGLFFAGDLASWNTALFYTTAANATLLGNTAPVWVGLAALLLFRERLGREFWLGLGLALGGALLIMSADFLRHPSLGLGDLLSLVAGLFYAGFFLFTQRAREGLSSLGAWWVSAVASTVGLLAVSVALGQPLTGYSLPTYLSLLGLALVTQVGGYLAVSYALGHLPASIVAPTLLGQALVTALLAIPLLGEPLSLTQLAGGGLLLGGIWLVNQRPSASR
jgi:drug/metabolite transporter (DMT)-like permease